MKKSKKKVSSKTSKTKPPIDPAEGPQIVLAGQIVTMDANRRVIKDGRLYIDKGCIVAVTAKGEAAPSGFQDAAVVDTGGTIFPGLIELHNHLSYNLLRLWNVPKKYGNRGQWAGIPEYRSLISGPMKLLGQRPDLLAALVRYVECKCLFGGTTTSQGIELFSNKGARRFYRGVVRNVEQTSDPNLPEAGTRIPDVDAKDGQAFLTQISKKTCYLLHLAEGKDTTARKHFLSLEFKKGEWAITKSLAGIHCAGLERPDFDVMASKGASMIWSPFSNMLLYGDTARVADAVQAGVRIGIGSDWSPSGSKNLLGELKVAHLWSQNNSGLLSDRQIVELATVNAAAILGWQSHVGSLEPNKCADLFVLEGKPQDPYGSLIKANESDVQLVLINGVPRCGSDTLMQALLSKGESFKVGGSKRVLNFAQKTADPDVAPISLTQAKKRLTKALKSLPNLPPAPVTRMAMMQQPLTWFLALDELAPTGMDVRPHLPLGGRFTMLDAKGKAAAAPPVIKPLKLDAVTVVDDSDFFSTLEGEKNLPDFVKTGLPQLY
jgi:cytosine/adenosine deaminase-related metal-dependent hydrolase